MLTPASAPVTVWAPAFSWEPPARLFRVERILWVERQGGFHCTLCEGTVRAGHREAHVEFHRQEWREFRREVTG